uniref:Uncharacterized protein n=1 Tax=Kalanchoe fedtschenkoi TaxID=63787 RepID=A0A7N0ZZS7_KALFE
MGSQCSTSSADVVTPAQSSANSNSNPRCSADLNSYAAACQQDPVLQSFDSAVRESTTRAVNTVALEVEFHSVSLDSLREVTGSLLDVNHEVVKVILECKKDIWKNSELSSLVDEYFENSLQILDFCNALEKCLKRARDSQLIIDVALQQYEDETMQQGFDERRYHKTLQELKNFKDLGNPFSDEFFLKFQETYEKQVAMLKKMELRRQKLDKKARSLKSWRTVSNVIFVSTLAAVLIFSVVAAAIAAQPVITALVGALAVPIGSMGKWINSLWKSYETEVMGELKVVDSMHIGTYIAVQDLDNIRIQVNKLETEIQSLLQNAGLALREEDTVKIVIDEIKKKLSAFTDCLDDLADQTAKCHRDIMKARTVILQRIIRHPSNSL